MRTAVGYYGLITILVSLALQPAAAATFSENEGGLIGSYSVIHSGGKADYVSLAEAAIDFTGYPGGAKGNYTFFLASNSTEPTNVAFGNQTNGFKVQLRPHQGLCTVTFTQQAPNSGFDGHLVLGANSIHSLDSCVKTDGFIVNGYLPNEPRALHFRNEDHSTGYPSSNRSVIVNIVGDSDHVSIRNCHVENRLTSSTGFTYGVNYTSVSPDGVTSLIPDYGLVHNSRVTANGWQGHGVSGHVQPGQIVPGWVAQQGLTVTSSTINASSRGVLLNQNAGGIIRDNVVRVHNPHSGWNAQAIFHSASNGFIGGAFEATGNRVFASGGQGLVTMLGIAQGEAIEMGNIDIVNNMVVLDVASPGERGVTNARAIQFGRASPGVARAAHNSVLLKTLSSWSIALRTITTYEPRPQVYNNILCTSGTELGMNLRINHPSIQSDGNVFAVDNGSVVGFDFDPPATLEDWRNISGQDQNSVEVDPRPFWASDEDLYLIASPAVMRCGILNPGSPPVLKDIRGRIRPPGRSMPGAHEPDPVDVIDEPAPLISWVGTKLRNRRGSALRLAVRLTVWNSGMEPLPADAALNIYVSDDETLSESDQLIHVHNLGGLTPTAPRKLRKKYRLDRSYEGKFLLAVVEQSTHSTLGNLENEAVFGPLVRKY